MQELTLGERLGRLLHERDLTQEKLGEISDVPRRTIQNILYDKTKSPGADTVAKLSKALGVTADELLYGRKPPSVPTAPEVLQKIEALIQLSPNEAELLGAFRTASPTLQQAILETVRRLINK